ncbi:hypothetical protein SAMN04488127_2050 [Bhargavaea ginsengi]|uniref:Uncharacterized protein n=1 Tax=Bhargavaea ginsengi TaxID=426757 RepID=A0A1H6ZD83_9BACL|nr:hypothetical protein [Bhargavaea ginsengi]SEJ51298.1 hypothetical protein SAMN04488127_2050 [Bhargavaea ginsengi]
MTKPKLSLMEAYMVESLRSKGVSNEEIITLVEQEDTEGLKEIEPRFDYSVLVKAAQKDLASFRSALSDGYEVKFVTFNGLKNLLRMRFGKEEDRDYSVMETGIQGLRLTSSELEQFKDMLSSNWRVTSDGSRTIKVELNMPAEVTPSTGE